VTEPRTPALVLHVAETAGWAGGETYLRTLATGLDPARFRLAVAVPEDGPLVERLGMLGVPSHRVPLAARLLNPGALSALVELFRRERPAVVQSHGARSNVYTRLAGRIAGVPAVLSTVHNSLFDYDVPRLRRAGYVLAERLTSPLADAAIAVSGAVARDLAGRYRMREDKVVTIRNGIDAEAFVAGRHARDLRAALDLAPGDRVIGLTARMTAQKGHRHLLDALPALLERVPRLRCLFVGDGPLRAELERAAARLGVAGVCRFTGARSDVADVLSLLDVAVLPSLSEGLPFALLEAMALGKPVVATDVGGNAEVVADGETGLIVPARDPAALARALTILLEQPLTARTMGQRGGARVRERFTLTQMCESLERLYVSTLRRKGRWPIAA
jgi:glycosyltransferase involved in cell wall biosynthesis